MKKKVWKLTQYCCFVFVFFPESKIQNKIYIGPKPIQIIINFSKGIYERLDICFWISLSVLYVIPMKAILCYPLNNVGMRLTFSVFLSLSELVPMSTHMRFVVPHTHLGHHKPHATYTHLFAVLLISNAVGFFDTGRSWRQKKNKPQVKNVVWSMWQGVCCQKLSLAGQSHNLAADQTLSS